MEAIFLSTLEEETTTARLALTKNNTAGTRRSTEI